MRTVNDITHIVHTLRQNNNNANKSVNHIKNASRFANEIIAGDIFENKDMMKINDSFSSNQSPRL